MKQAVAGLFMLVGVVPIAMAGEPITIGETVSISSKILGESRTILVSTPANYSQTLERYPVLYMTDGDAHLTHTRGTVDFLVRNGLISDLIIVGITNTDRTRDLTPTHAFRNREDGTREEIANSGGASKFLDFFAQELIPYLEAHYRTAPYRILAGHSLGGLFAIHALVARPEIFNAYIAASPSLTWDDDYILRATAKALENRKELRRTLFVTMANEEQDDPAPTRFDRLRKVLEADKTPGFAWGTQLMADEDHGSVVLRTHYFGLRKVFEGWQLPGDRRTRLFSGSVDDLKKHFASVSERFGVTVVPPEQAVNQVGYQRLGRTDIDGALTFFRFNVELYPDSANVYDSLGEALERAGRLPDALVGYTKAVENAKKLGDRRLEAFTRNRDRAAASVK